MRIEGQVVLFSVSIEIIRTENLGNFDQLVEVVSALEEGFLFENHSCKHASERPDVQGVIVSLHVNQQFGPFKVARGDSHVVFLARVVELGETPVDEA